MFHNVESAVTVTCISKNKQQSVVSDVVYVKELRLNIMESGSTNNVNIAFDIEMEPFSDGVIPKIEIKGGIICDGYLSEYDIHNAIIQNSNLLKDYGKYFNTTYPDVVIKNYSICCIARSKNFEIFKGDMLYLEQLFEDEEEEFED